MMAETPAHAHIKQEIDTTCCSPSPSNGSFTTQGFIFNNNPSANTVRTFHLSDSIPLTISQLKRLFIYLCVCVSIDRNGLQMHSH